MAHLCSELDVSAQVRAGQSRIFQPVFFGTNRRMHATIERKQAASTSLSNIQRSTQHRSTLALAAGLERSPFEPL
jgi:hypothetical protein